MASSARCVLAARPRHRCRYARRAPERPGLPPSCCSAGRSASIRLSTLARVRIQDPATSRADLVQRPADAHSASSDATAPSGDAARSTDRAHVAVAQDRVRPAPPSSSLDPRTGSAPPKVAALVQLLPSASGTTATYARRRLSRATTTQGAPPDRRHVVGAVPRWRSPASYSASSRRGLILHRLGRHGQRSACSPRSCRPRTSASDHGREAPGPFQDRGPPN